WQWTGPLPTPVLEGSKATYVDVQPGVDLVIQATLTGFEQFLVLKQRPTAAAAFRLGLRADGGAKLTQSADGLLALQDQAGKVAANAPAPLMWDAKIDARSGEHTKIAQVPAT